MSETHSHPKRDTWLAVKRGLALRCPNCGKGKLLAGYLKQEANCSNCGERTGEIRADDGPAWATILLVGHIVSPMFFVFANQNAQEGFIAFLVVAGLMIGLTLVLLPRVKGGFIGLIWAMHAGEAVSAEP